MTTRPLRNRLGAAALALLVAASLAMPGPVGASPDAPRGQPREASVPLLPTWSDDLLDLVGAMPVQEAGRVKPLSTWARFALLQLNGKSSHLPAPDSAVDANAKRSAVAWALDALLFPERAREQRIFLVEEDQVLVDLGIEIEGREKRDRYSYDELAPARALLARRVDEMRHEIERRERIAGKVRNEDFTPAQWEQQRLERNVRLFERVVTTLDFARARVDASGFASHLAGLADPRAAAPLEVLRRLPEAWLALKPADDAASAGPAAAEQETFRALAELRVRLTEAAGDDDVFGMFPPGELAADGERWYGPKEAFRPVERGGAHDPALVTQLRDERVIATWRRDFDRVASWLDGWARAVEERGDSAAVERHIGLVSAGVTKAAAQRGEIDKVELEIAYYDLDPLFKGLLAYILAFLLLAFTWLAPRSRSLYAAALLALVVGLCAHVVGITMRCMIRGRPPVSTLYETIVFIGACAVIACLAMERMNRRRIAVVLAAVLGAGSLWMAQGYEVFKAEDTMPELQAVLDTNFWLSTHVTTVTLGYAAGLLAAAIGHVTILGRIVGFRANDEGFYRTLYRMTYGVIAFGLLFSVVGTILGGVWANDSWGRFWGWDPKENGALMICLWETAILHARMGGYIKGHGLAMAAVATGPIVAFSWWGVNLLEIGLHSYGFTSGVGARLRIYYVIELAVLLAGLTWWILSRPSRRSEAPGA